MNVMFVSECSKRALPATRRILDQFAERKGNRTWLTPITEAGLDTVLTLLRKGARRNTAVACHLVRGGEIELLWIVGNRRRFDRRGNVPTDRSRRPRLNRYREDDWNHGHSIALMAAIAGLFHDFGKANALFQDKIHRRRRESWEPLRHEWLSVRLFEAFVGDDPDQAWLARFAELKGGESPTLLEGAIFDQADQCFENPLKRLKDRPLAWAIAWLIVSHHRLPLPLPKRIRHRGIHHRLESDKADAWVEKFSPAWNSPQILLSAKKELIARVHEFPEGLPVESATWRARAATLAKRAREHDRLLATDWPRRSFALHVARACLMLADHWYSAGDTRTRWRDEGYRVYANTTFRPDTSDEDFRQPHQRLDEHCIGVSERAWLVARSLPSLRTELPAVGDVRALRTRSSKQFAWQNRAYSLGERAAEASRRCGGFFVNMASTGTGKTLANARCALGLSKADEGMRVSILLGLRTLTLQTARALRARTGLKPGELAAMVGSTAVSELHAAGGKEVEGDDAGDAVVRSIGRAFSESAEPLFDATDNVVYDGMLDSSQVGRWLRGERNGNRLHQLLSAPVLVATIDQLALATESLRGGRQIAPILRLLTSDLILDEPDDFDLADQPALCRLVHFAGLLGSRVILSSATLPPALVETLFDAYRAGRREFAQAVGEGEGAIVCGWIDEFSVDLHEIDDIAIYADRHASFVETRIAKLSEQERPRRLLRLVDVVPERTVEAAVAQTFLKEIERLHAEHANVAPDGHGHVSIGLVRMANIDPLVAVAREIATVPDALPFDLHLCVYHARHPLYRRTLIERELDAVLYRREEEAFWRHPTIRAALARERREQVFVVLASPVAEVGRDHCYDWAIVEPSSMRSLIQLVGRVLRHRPEAVPGTPNVVVLSRNLSALRGELLSYRRPGYESKRFPLASHDLRELLPPDARERPSATSRLRESAAPAPTVNLADLEHAATRAKLGGATGSGRFPANLWWNEPVDWCGALQQKTPFREGAPTETYALVTDDKSLPPRFERLTNGEHVPAEDLFDARPPRKTNESVLRWPALDDGALFARLEEDEVAEKLELEAACRRYMTVSLRAKDSADRWQYDPWFGIR